VRCPGIGIGVALAVVASAGAARTPSAARPWPDPIRNPESPLMLAGDWVPADPQQIDFDALPRVPSEHATVSDVVPTGGVNQHNYLAHYAGKFWVMWSDGPAVEDRVGQRVKFATSRDGSSWSTPEFLTPEPPGSGPGSALYGTRDAGGLRWISRGFWPRDGQLLALASLDEAAGFFGPSLALHAFRLDPARSAWQDLGVVVDDAINNFPPKRLPGGDWMMSRRPHDYKTAGVQFLVGGRKAIDQWESHPVLGSASELAAEEPFWWVLPDDNLMALFRDNRRSGYLYRSFSTSAGHSWSRPTRTNFPDATSKMHGLRLSDGRYVLVSNANPRRRDPLVISTSNDGMVFTRMGYLVGGRRVDYPHVIEHEGYLLVAFSGGKQTVEVLKIRIADLDRLRAE
jgi:BNR repeat-like domain